MNNTKKLKVLELFAGIRATSEALNRLNIDHDTFTVEYDKKVQDVANMLHGTEEPTRDITKFDTNEKYDLVVAGFPCQPFSMAGKKQGFEDEKGRGKLYQDTLRVIKSTNPDYVILENVKAITFQKHKWIITEIEDTLKELGYKVHTQIINAKNYLPQNRERLFIIASKKKQPQLIKEKNHNMILKDFLEKEIDDNLYYGTDKLEAIFKWKAQEKPLKKIAHSQTKTTRTQPGTSSQQLVMGENNDTLIDLIAEAFGTTHLVVEKNGEKHWLTSEGTTRKIGYREAEKNWLLPISKNYTNNIVNDVDGILSTLTASSPKKIILLESWLLEHRQNINGLFHGTFNAENYITGIGTENERNSDELAHAIGTITATGANSKQKIFESLVPLKIRSITPRESLRLMGWTDDKIDRVINLPKTKLYFTAGNSMVIPVMEDILKELLEIK